MNYDPYQAPQYQGQFQPQPPAVQPPVFQAPQAPQASQAGGVWQGAYQQPGQPAGWTAPQQPSVPPVYYPAYPQGYAAPAPGIYPPPYAVGHRRDPRLSGAAKTMNRMCLVVLLQTVAAFLIEIPLITALTVSGVDIFSDKVAYQLFSAAMVPLSTAMPFFVYLLIGHKDAASYLKFEKVGFVTSVLCVLAGLSICLLGNLPAMLVQTFFGNFGYEPAEVIGGGESWLVLILEFLTTAVVVPVMEEFAFRGVLLSALRKHGTGFAIVASALIFSLVHMDFSNVVFAFVAGLVFGCLYVRTGNLWITVCIHFLNNGIAVIGSYEDFLFGNMAGLIDVLLLWVPIGIGIIALIFLCLSKSKRSWLFRRVPAGNGASAALRGGEGALAVVRAPLFWVIVAIMAAYTTSLFF